METKAAHQTMQTPKSAPCAGTRRSTWTEPRALVRLLQLIRLLQLKLQLKPQLKPSPALPPRKRRKARHPSVVERADGHESWVVCDFAVDRLLYSLSVQKIHVQHGAVFAAQAYQPGSLMACMISKCQWSCHVAWSLCLNILNLNRPRLSDRGLQPCIRSLIRAQLGCSWQDS